MNLFRSLPTLALVTGAATVASLPAQARITAINVYHSQSVQQDASGLSAVVASVQGQVFTDVKGEFDTGVMTAPDGSVYNPVLNQSSANYPLDQFGAYFGPQPFGTFTAQLTNSVTAATATATAAYTADHYPDVVPEVSNYAALQHIDPTKSFQLILTRGFTMPADAQAASTTFFIFDAVTNQRLVQYSLDPGDVVFTVAANTAAPNEKIGYYFESDINYVSSVDGVVATNIYRNITTGQINAVPEPATWCTFILGAIGIGFAVRRQSTRSPDAAGV